MLTNPQKFGRRETGQRRLSSDFDQFGAADVLMHVLALSIGSLVVPEDGGSN